MGRIPKHPFLFSRFLATLLIACQLIWGLPASAADTLRSGQEAETHAAGLEERLTGVAPASRPQPPYRPAPLPIVPAGLEEEAGETAIPERLVQDFGLRQAAIIFDETQKAVSRLMPGVSEEKKAEEVRRLVRKIRPITYIQMLLDPRRLVFYALFTVVASVFAGFQPGLILAMVAIWALDVWREWQKARPDVRSATIGGAHTGFRILIRRQMSEGETRMAVSHEIAHEVFSIRSSLQNTVARLRVREELPDTVSLGGDAPIPSVLPEGIRPEDVRIAELQDRLMEESFARTGFARRLMVWLRISPARMVRVMRWLDKVFLLGWIEFRWRYVYGSNLADVLWEFPGHDFDKCYQMVILIGNGMSLEEALSQVLGLNGEDTLASALERAAKTHEPPAATPAAGEPPVAAGLEEVKITPAEPQDLAELAASLKALPLAPPTMEALWAAPDKPSDRLEELMSLTPVQVPPARQGIPPMRFVVDTHAEGDPEVLRFAQWAVLLMRAGVPVQFSGVATAWELEEAQKELPVEARQALEDHIEVYDPADPDDYQRALETAKASVFGRADSHQARESVLTRAEPLYVKWFMGELQRLGIQKIFSPQLFDRIESYLTAA